MPKEIESDLMPSTIICSMEKIEMNKKEISENSKKDEEEQAQKIITYIALQEELKKQKRKLNKAIQDNKDGYLNDYITMQRTIIKNIENTMKNG